ncbi:MAG: cellulase family glycosylhydrolase, partial [Spirochaetales bacterium]|nr:cellulase family glycosylhydrolase [Spirochaetales bacterium]
KTKNLKLIVILFITFFCVTHVFCDTPWLHTEGNQIKDPQGNRVILRGVSMIDIGAEESWYGGAFNNIDRITNQNDSQGSSPGWYTKIIRIPIIPYDSGFQSPIPFQPGNDNLYNNLLRPVVDYCKQKDVYVIIDWHYIDDVNNHVQTTTEFWNYMAPKFANDSHVLFELYNEPINNGSNDASNWAVVRGYMQNWYNLVRAAAPNNPILVGTPSWCQILTPTINNPVNGENIIYVVHTYPSHWKNSWCRDQISQTAGVHPLMLTEWGFSQSNEEPGSIAYGSISDYGRPIMDFIESYGISNTAWVANYEWGPPMFWTNWTLRCGEGEMGCFVKDQLYAMRNVNTPGTGTPVPTATPLSTSTPTPTPTQGNLRGDVNGDTTIDIVDALLIAQHYVGLNPPGFNASAADTNCDNNIDIVDALLIAQYYVGLITVFC